MTFPQLLAELRRRQIAYVADRAGRLHFDSPFGFPADLVLDVARHREALLRLGSLRAAAPVAVGRAS